jgi:hypothetical protein
MINVKLNEVDDSTANGYDPIDEALKIIEINERKDSDVYFNIYYKSAWGATNSVFQSRATGSQLFQQAIETAMKFKPTNVRISLFAHEGGRANAFWSKSFEITYPTQNVNAGLEVESEPMPESQPLGYVEIKPNSPFDINAERKRLKEEIRKEFEMESEKINYETQILNLQSENEKLANSFVQLKNEIEHGLKILNTQNNDLKDENTRLKIKLSKTLKELSESKEKGVFGLPKSISDIGLGIVQSIVVDQATKGSSKFIDSSPELQNKIRQNLGSLVDLGFENLSQYSPEDEDEDDFGEEEFDEVEESYDIEESEASEVNNESNN